MPPLDPLLHQPARTHLVAFLAARGEATFSEIKKALEVTDGNLGAHLNKLVEAELVSSRDNSSLGRSQTVFYLTAEGKLRLQAYISELNALMQLGRSTNDSPLSISPLKT